MIDEERVALEHELRLLKHRLKQREDALIVLNKRLRILEQNSMTDHSRDLAEAQTRLLDVERELMAMRQTKTFRYTNSVRQVYGRLRQLSRR